MLDDNTARVALGLRLNLSPFYHDPEGAPVRCPYAASSARVCQQVDLRSKFAHGLSCIFENNNGRSMMHDHVLQCVLEIATACTLFARRTPQGYFSVDPSGRKVDRKQPDGLVDFRDLGGSCLFDVRGVCPTSQSNISVNAKDHHKSMQLAADDKTTKYCAIADQRGVGFQPFVFNTYGGLHSSAQSFVDKMINKYKQYHSPDKADALKYSHLAQLSVSIMRDNADILVKAHGRAH